MPNSSCTTTLVTKGASANGSVLVSHSNDGFISDPSIVYVPAKDHAIDSRRPIYPSPLAAGEMSNYNCFFNPRLIAPERAPGYDYKNSKSTKPLGYIQESSHTYAYIDGDYGIMNEHGLMLGECTNTSARLPKISFKQSGGIFYAAELGRVALERCINSREAVHLIGKLIDEFGIYGTGETLIVADKNEGWIIEMQPTEAGYNDLWVAQKVPDGEFFVAANQFRIHLISADNPNQIFNPHLPQLLNKIGWAEYDEDGNIDWVKSVQGNEYFHPYYSMRRVWRAMSLVAPSAKIPAEVENYYSESIPFSIRPDKLLSIEDIMQIHRDYYKGTEFDRKKNEGAGLFASPYRYDSENWERAITSADTSCTWITQNNDKLPAPIVWLSINAPAESVYIPLTVSQLPQGYEQVNRNRYDPTKVWWITSQVSALTRGYYSSLIRYVLDTAHKHENKSKKLIENHLDKSSEEFAEVLIKNAENILQDWTALFGKLLVLHDMGNNLKYDKRHEPKRDSKRKY